MEPIPIEDTLSERESTHGNYVSRAILACTLLDVMESSENWAQLNSAQQYGLIMVAGKLSRILCGDHEEPDHWRDIAGYAVLVERSLEHARDAQEALWRDPT